MKLQKLAERELISAIHKEFSQLREDIILGIGDDAAVIKQGRIPLILTTDMLVEDVDFIRKIHPAFYLGRKSLNINLSDIAAMGGRPKFALLGLGLPLRLDTAWVNNFFHGFKSAARLAGVALVGGDISESKKITISVTVVGQGKNIVQRNGGRHGHFLFVSGFLGDAKLGFLLMKKGYKFGDDRRADPLLRAFLDPVPQLLLGEELARLKIASSMIDTSDGLSVDLFHLCQESNTGAEVYLENLPFSPGMHLFGKNRIELALHGGEDFQLLFSVPPGKLRSIQKLQKKYKITFIGKMLCQKGIFTVEARGQRKPLEPKGYEHFG